MLTDDTALTNMVIAGFTPWVRDQLSYITDSDCVWKPDGTLCKRVWDIVNEERTMDVNIIIKRLVTKPGPGGVEDLNNFLRAFNCILGQSFLEQARDFYSEGELRDYSAHAKYAFLFDDIWREESRKLILYIILCKPYLVKDDEED